MCVKLKKTKYINNFKVQKNIFYLKIMETLDNLDMLELLRSRHSSRLTKVYKKRRNPFLVYNDIDFRKKYRFTKENAKKLINLVKEDLKGNQKKKGGQIPVYLQVLAALRCWGRNKVQEDCAEFHGFSQSTMNRICQKVATAFAKKSRTFIKMAMSAEDQIKVMDDFQKIAGFKKVMGAIDCSHIRIQAVGGDDAQLYVNRKGYFSFNVQVVCDASLKITDIVACWRGSTHDSRIFNESKIKEKFENRHFMGRLLGDGGYKCTNYLFTPVQNPKDTKEENYNKAHIKTRNVVERVFGVWKSRFRILLEKMRLSRKNAKTVIVALAVLHNLSIIYKEDKFDEADVNLDQISRESSTNTNLHHDLDDDISRALYIQQNF